MDYTGLPHTKRAHISLRACRSRIFAHISFLSHIELRHDRSRERNRKITFPHCHLERCREISSIDISKVRSLDSGYAYARDDKPAPLEMTWKRNANNGRDDGEVSSPIVRTVADMLQTKCKCVNRDMSKREVAERD